MSLAVTASHADMAADALNKLFADESPAGRDAGGRCGEPIKLNLGDLGYYRVRCEGNLVGEVSRAIGEMLPGDRIKQRRGASLFPGIPASYDLLGFFDGCEAPAQLDNILPHGIFNDFLFFNPQDQRLRR
jgi:hypothetical protein